MWNSPLGPEEGLLTQLRFNTRHAMSHDVPLGIWLASQLQDYYNIFLHFLIQVPGDGGRGPSVRSQWGDLGSGLTSPRQAFTQDIGEHL